MDPRRRVVRLRIIAVLVVAGLVLSMALPLLTSCSAGDDAAEPGTVGAPVATASTVAPGPTDRGADAASALRVDLVDDAVAALVAERGGDVALYEVNASPDLVNLFVATTAEDGSTTATAYVFTPEDGLGDPADPQQASGPTFTPDQIAFDAATVLDGVLAELHESIPRLFAVNGARGPDGPADAVEYRIVLQSPAGGTLSVMVEPDGGIIGVDAE